MRIFYFLFCFCISSNLLATKDSLVTLRTGQRVSGSLVKDIMDKLMFVNPRSLYGLGMAATQPTWVVLKNDIQYYQSMGIYSRKRTFTSPETKEIIANAIQFIPSLHIQDPLEPQVKLRDGSYVPKALFQKTMFHLGRRNRLFASPDNLMVPMDSFLSAKFKELLTGDTETVSNVKKILSATIRHSNYGTLINTDPTGRWDCIPNTEIVKAPKLTA